MEVNRFELLNQFTSSTLFCPFIQYIVIGGTPSPTTEDLTAANGILEDLIGAGGWLILL